MDTMIFRNKIVFFLLVISLFSGISVTAQTFNSKNDHTGSWDDNTSWLTTSPGTSLNATNVNVYGKMTRAGALTNGGSTTLNIYDTLTVNGTFSNLSTVNVQANSQLVVTTWSSTGGSVSDIYGTVIVLGDLTTSTNIHVHTGGLLIVLGDLTITNAGAAAIINDGTAVAVGQFSSGGDVTTSGTFYIYDDVPSYTWGATINGTDYNGGANDATLTSKFPTEASIPSWLQTILTNLGVTCGASNTIGYDQFICTLTTPAQLTGNAVTGLGTTTYSWESSTTSATTGFANAAGTPAQRTGQNYTAPAALTQTTWYRRRLQVTSPSTCGFYSNVVKVTVGATGSWTGATDNTWSTLGNWCGAVPTIATDALIPVTTSGRYPIISGAANTKNLTIDLGASVTVSSNTLTIAGNLVNNGGITSNSTIAFVASAAQTTSGLDLTTTNLTINNNSGVTVQSNVQVNTTFTMTAGAVNLSSKTLTLGTSISSLGTLTYTAGKLVGGTFTRWIAAATLTEANAMRFPLGTSADSRPFYVWPTAAPSAGGTISISHTGATTTTSPISIADTGGPIVRRQNSFWTVSANGVSGGTYSLKGGGTGFGTVAAVSDLRLMLANGVTGTHATASAPGTTSDFLVARSGITAAGNFYIGSVGTSSTLPIKLLNFTATKQSNSVSLNWATATELNFDHFNLERSLDGKKFELLATLQGNGTTKERHDYSFVDESPALGVSYYRLQSVDFDGYTETFEVVSINFEGAKDISLYPNPVIDSSLNFHLNFQPTTEILVTVTSVTGMERIRGVIKPNETDINLGLSLEPGVYIVKMASIDFNKVSRIVVR